MFRGDAPQVAAIGRDNRVSLKKVQIMRDLGTEVEITGGLNQDERIVANPPDSIGNGEEVRVMEAAGDKTPGSPTLQRAQGRGDQPKTADEMAQTGRKHGE